MLRWATALAMLDEIAKRAAKPRHRDLALGMECIEQLRPAALVAIKAPGLDQLGAGVFVFDAHGFRRQIHSVLIPAAVITRRQRAISRSTRSRYSCGVDGIATLPASTSRACTSGKPSTWRTSWLRRSTMADGVPGAITRPSHDVNSMPGTVSATVGASGISA